MFHLPMSVYLFQLGHQPLLSQAEIITVLHSKKITITKQEPLKGFLLIHTDQNINALELIHQLGGTVKILEKIDCSPNPKSIANHLIIEIPTGKINFSLTGGNFALQIKKELKNLDRSVRYVEPKNTATILHNNLVDTKSDLTIFEKNVFVTTGIQDLEGFSERDYDRPKTDSKSGMLPPKLARIMINLSETNPDEIILDPFCGSGTVLMEAAELGFFNIAGTDLSAKAIQDSTKNLEWLKQTKKLNPVLKLKVTDATALSQEFSLNTIGAIVAEPYMGKPQTGRETLRELQNTARELRQLFEKSFSEFKKILKPNAHVVFIIPEFHYQKEVITIDCLPSLKQLGFVPIALLPGHESIVYKRPNQFVARRIFKFQIKKS